MRNGDKLTRDELRAKIQQAVKDGDTQAFYQAFDQMVQCHRRGRAAAGHGADPGDAAGSGHRRSWRAGACGS